MLDVSDGCIPYSLGYSLGLYLVVSSSLDFDIGEICPLPLPPWPFLRTKGFWNPALITLTLITTTPKCSSSLDGSRQASGDFIEKLPASQNLGFDLYIRSGHWSLNLAVIMCETLCSLSFSTWRVQSFCRRRFMSPFHVFSSRIFLVTYSTRFCCFHLVCWNERIAILIAWCKLFRWYLSH